MLYLCRNGHVHRKQENTISCARCKANERRRQKAIKHALEMQRRAKATA